MEIINKDISALKNMLEKRETYIRFSPIGTSIMWIMYILFYVFAWDINSNYYTIWFFAIWLLWIIIVTILSILNSKNKGEKLLPKPIRYIIWNMIFIWMAITPLLLILSVMEESMKGLFPIISITYWLLIIVSRFCIQKFLTYFGYMSFFIGLSVIMILILWNSYEIFYNIWKMYEEYYQELILILFWFGHLVMWYILHINNNK